MAFIAPPFVRSMRFLFITQYIRETVAQWVNARRCYVTLMLNNFESVAYYSGLEIENFVGEVMYGWLFYGEGGLVLV